MKTSIVVDFMSLAKKVNTNNITVLQDMFQKVFNDAYGVCNTGQMDIVYDSYVETSLKELERNRRSLQVKPLTYINLQQDTPRPVQMERFWACSKNKENLQVLSRDFYINLSKSKQLKFVLSGYLTDSSGVQDCIEVTNGVKKVIQQLESSIEEADGRMIPHVAEAAKNGIERVVVLSNDTDVVVLMLITLKSFLN